MRGSLCSITILLGPFVEPQAASAQIATPTDGLWTPNGPVHAIACDANTLYVGGSFAEVHACLPYGVALDHSTAHHLSDHAKPNGVVRASFPDGNGGWLEGGAPMTPSVARRVLRMMEAKPAQKAEELQVTEREPSILALLVKGHTYKRIAAELDVSCATGTSM